MAQNEYKDKNPIIYLAGIGMGREDQLTGEVLDCLDRADAVMGARSSRYPIMEVSGVRRSWATLVISSFFVLSDSRSFSISFLISAAIWFKLAAILENSSSPITSITVFRFPSEMFCTASEILLIYRI